jgi:hypothetical protein
LRTTKFPRHRPVFLPALSESLCTLRECADTSSYPIQSVYNPLPARNPPAGFNAPGAEADRTAMPHQQRPLLENETQQRDLSRTISDSPATTLPRPQIHIPSVPKVKLEPKKDAQWNTANLGLRLGADCASAASAAVLIAPIIAVIDR